MAHLYAAITPVVGCKIAMSLSLFLSVCLLPPLPSPPQSPLASFPISQLIAVVNRDGMASKAATVVASRRSSTEPERPLLVYSRLQWRSHYHAHDDDGGSAVSEWAPSFLVFDKRTWGEAASLRSGGPWGTVHLVASCTRRIDTGDD